MKKTYLIFLSLFISFTLHSQEEFSKAKFSIGVKGGLNLSDKFDDKPWNSKIRYRTGLNIDYSIGDYLFLRTGANYNQKGSTYRNNDIKNYYKFEYITVPIGIGLFIPLDDGLNISFIFSGYTDLGLSIESRLKESGHETLSSDSWEASNLKKNDLGVSLEGEFAYRQILLNVGFERGLRNISLKRDNMFSKWNNGCLYLTLGYRFIFK